MRKRLTTKNVLAAFVLAFLCFNVGGALCLTYCTQFAMAAAPAAADDSQLSEHCKKAKKEAEKKNQSLSFQASDGSCCMLPVSMFATPVEKRTRFSESLIADFVPTVVAERHPYTAPVLNKNALAITPVYRPPPLDHSVDRLLNCVIRT